MIKMMMMTTRPVLPPPESDDAGAAGAGATTGVKVADGETAAGDREAVCDCGDPEDDGVPVAVGVVEALGGPTGENELDGDAGVARGDAPERLGPLGPEPAQRGAGERASERHRDAALVAPGGKTARCRKLREQAIGR